MHPLIWKTSVHNPSILLGSLCHTIVELLSITSYICAIIDKLPCKGSGFIIFFLTEKGPEDTKASFISVGTNLQRGP
jgi:hypothetical protein